MDLALRSTLQCEFGGLGSTGGGEEKVGMRGVS